MKRISPRQMLRMTAGVTAIIPLSLLTGRMTRAEELPHVDPNDAQAKALEYVHASPSRTNCATTVSCIPGQRGQNGVLAPFFPGKSVNAKGWCKSWVKMAA